MRRGNFLSGVAYLAVIVGALLVANAVGVAVAQRRAAIGTLRTLGATRGAIFGAFVAEGTLLGVLGAGEGIALGLLLAQPAVGYALPAVGIVYDVASARRLDSARSTSIAHRDAPASRLRPSASRSR